MFGLNLAACGPQPPSRYAQQHAAARAAYERGQYTQAAHHWQQASTTASDKKERDEALYRQAAALRRAGQWQQAYTLLTALSKQASGERSARAAFDAAFLLLEHGEPERGKAALLQALRRYPNSGLASKAARRLIEREQELAGPEQVLQFIVNLEKQTRGSELQELLLYEKAQQLEATLGARAAMPVYRELILSYPYPRGRFWDESVLRLAQLLRSVDQPATSTRWLRWLLAHREAATFVGSYERHYAEGHLLLAEILRDDLLDWRAARDEFRAVFEAYPTSRLRDDALWQAILLSQRYNDSDAACTDVARLQREQPTSRYVEPGRTLCKTHKPH